MILNNPLKLSIVSLVCLLILKKLLCVFGLCLYPYAIAPAILCDTVNTIEPN